MLFVLAMSVVTLQKHTDLTPNNISDLTDLSMAGISLILQNVLLQNQQPCCKTEKPYMQQRTGRTIW